MFTRKVTEGEAGLVFPEAEVAVAVAVWDPSVRGVFGRQSQLPLVSDVVEQASTPSTLTWMVRPGAAVPLRLGLLV